jgi:hypothetical protein
MGLFGKKKDKTSNLSGGVDVSMGSIGPANLSMDLVEEEKQPNTQPSGQVFSPFARR